MFGMVEDVEVANVEVGMVYLEKHKVIILASPGDWTRLCLGMYKLVCRVDRVPLH